MKTRAILTLAFVLSSGVAVALECIAVSSDRGLQHFNPQVLGASADDPVQPLLRWRLTDLRPVEVTLMLTSNRYTGATLVFPRDITPQEAVRSIETIFMQCKATPNQKEPRLWIEAESGFTVRLAVETNMFKVTYHGARPPREPSFKDAGHAEAKISTMGL